jgi:hypothetical protein
MQENGDFELEKKDFVRKNGVFAFGQKVELYIQNIQIFKMMLKCYFKICYN